jgi:hypothetical protein
MVLIFNDEIDNDSAIDFCDQLTSKIYTLRENDYLDIYFSTNGGENSSRLPIANTIIKYQDYLKFNIHDRLSSNGFLLLIELMQNDVPVYMTTEFNYCMIHKTDASMYNHRPYGYETILNSFIKKYNTRVSRELKKLGVSDEQIEKYNRAEDVYFSPEETLKLFPNIKIRK